MSFWRRMRAWRSSGWRRAQEGFAGRVRDRHCSCHARSLVALGVTAAMDGSMMMDWLNTYLGKHFARRRLLHDAKALWYYSWFSPCRQQSWPQEIDQVQLTKEAKCYIHLIPQLDSYDNRITLHWRLCPRLIAWYDHIPRYRHIDFRP